MLRRIVRCTSTRKDTNRKTENQTWKDSCKKMEIVGLKEEDVLDRTKWKNIHNHAGSSR